MQGLTRLWRYLPIGSKLAALAGLPVVAVILALTLLTVHRERVSFRQELESQADLLLATLPLTMRDALYHLEVDELLDVATVVSTHENLTRFVVYDSEGAILVDAAQATPVFAQIADPLGTQLLQMGADRLYLDWQADELVAGRAVILGNQKIGAVALGLSTAPLNQKITQLTRQSVLLALLALLGGGGLALLLAHQITTPINELATVADQMTKSGDRAARVHIKMEDEIGQLGTAFNQMAAAIQRRESELRELAAGLERTVEARTAELREQNETLVRVNTALSAARQEAEAANRAKSAVLSMVTHELRTPLTSILGFAHLIGKRAERLDCPANLAAECDLPVILDRMSENADIIISEGERLLALINNMLDLSKIESGKATWNMQPLSIAKVIQQSVAATSALFQNKGLELIVDVAEGLPPAMGDPDRLIQVVINLLSNAVKFTESGTVTCRAWLAPPPPQGTEAIVVSVADTGIGIAPQDFGKVFELFVQVGEARSQGMTAAQGTGLGLPICKQIIEHHGGRIWIESTLGEGSTFYFTLPVATA